MLAGMIGPTDVDGGAEPACPDCTTLMRATEGGGHVPVVWAGRAVAGCAADTAGLAAVGDDESAPGVRSIEQTPGA